MKKTAKRLTALALSAAMLTAPAGAITADGQSETWFDGVWSLIDAFSIKTEHDPYVLQNYINKYLEKHPEEMYDVINDILGLLDTHSMYLSSEEYSQGFSTLEGFVGIGVGLQQTAGGVQIGEVMRYSAAEEAGLQIGDLIVKIDGEDVSGAETADVASKLRGQEGTTVSVTVRRQGRDITVSITRRQVNQVYVSNSTLTQGVEYIKISSFASENDWQAFSEIWNGLAKKNTRAVVLDLRGNGGGLIDVAFKIANAMTPDKGVTLAGVRYRDDMGGLDETVSTGGGLPLNKIVVLVNGGTASAAAHGHPSGYRGKRDRRRRKDLRQGAGSDAPAAHQRRQAGHYDARNGAARPGLLGGQGPDPGHPGRQQHGQRARGRPPCARHEQDHVLRRGLGQYLRDDRASSAARPHRRADEHL